MKTSADKLDQSDKGGSKKPVSKPKDKRTKEKNPKSTHKPGKGFRDEEINRLLDLVDTHLPLGAVGWEAVAGKCNKTLPWSYSERSAEEALKCKFGTSKNAPNRAKHIQREIESHSGAIDLDDDNDHNDLGDDTTHEDEDEEDDKEDTDDHGQEGSSHPEQDQDVMSGNELDEAMMDDGTLSPSQGILAPRLKMPGGYWEIVPMALMATPPTDLLLGIPWPHTSPLYMRCPAWLEEERAAKAATVATLSPPCVV
ncbi:hypothetical protein BDK51DRAFT_34601 [Blyttiomyces helicus]|uniref:Uncharacterized protein n=1 Tax=Blyttiomyces helicus TaxID=388810 RepID=A0A4P9WQ76_9FUNG|nr:hypothetical protein BDK51DRAFT_34601 [Blyttiomyces helicus]|eukprot:RKO94742.1 hypothetical protein BDK51DRAFT_34601 [Blyttiomyces helicus]